MDEALELTRRAQASHFWFRGFRRFITPVLQAAAAGRRDLRLLDCGCGVGQNLALLAPYGRTFGFDLTASGVRAARASGRPLAQADVTRIPFLPDTFDVAVCFDVLQSVPDDSAAVAEMGRVLRPRGALVLTVSALEMLRGDHSESWSEVRRYSPALVRQLAAGAGLEVERVQFLFGSLFPLMWSVRAWQRVRRRHGGPRPESDIRVPAAPVNAVLTWVVGAEAAVAPYLPAPIGSSLLLVARKPS
jgi:SAM-dependent methyltransferase